MFVALLAVITFGIYARVVGYDFINFDDDNYVTGNAMVQQGFSPEGLKYAFSITATKRAYWHPLTWLSHMLDCQLFGLNAGLHHLINLLLHMLNSLLLFFVFRLMSGTFLPSALVALCFALHPLSVDSVAWISERKNVLSTLFWMLTMLAYIPYSRRPGVFNYLIVFFVFTLGLLAKPMLVTLPCVLLLMDFWPLGRVRAFQVTAGNRTFSQITVAKLLLEKVPLIAASLTAILISSHSLKVMGVFLNTAQVPMLIRIENAIVSYVKYLVKIIWPANLAPFYPFPVSIPAWQVFSATGVLAAISAMVIIQLKKRPWLAVGWFWFLGTLFPVSGLVQGGLWPEMADRWAYIPQIGIFIIVAWPISRMIGSGTTQGNVTAVTVGALLTILSAVTWVQIGHWKNSTTLFSHALAVTGPNAIVHRNLGQALLEKKDYDGAIAHYRKSTEFNSLRPEVHANLAAALLAKDKPQAALKHYKASIKLRPHEPSYYVKAGLILIGAGKSREALALFNKAVSLEPEDIVARYNRGYCLADTGNFESGEQEVLKTLVLAPESAETYYNIGAFYGKFQRPDKAARYLKKALARNPDHAAANFNLGIIAVGQNETKSAELFFIAAVTTRHEHIDARNNLGLLYAKTGRPFKAIEQFQKALETDPGDVLVRFNLADTLMQAGSIAAASTQYAQILKVDPHHEGARIGYQETSQFLSSIDAELKHAEDLLRFDPESPALLERMGDLYVRRGDVETGLDYYRKMQSLYPNYLRAVNKTAAAFSKIEKYADAIVHFKRAIALAPKKPEGYFNVACMYSRLDKTDQALAWLKHAVDRGYNKWEQVKTDPDLENLRNDPAFQAFMTGR